MRVCLLAFTLGAAAAYHRGHHRLRQLEADPDLERDEPEKIINKDCAVFTGAAAMKAKVDEELDAAQAAAVHHRAAMDEIDEEHRAAMDDIDVLSQPAAFFTPRSTS